MRINPNILRMRRAHSTDRRWLQLRYDYRDRFAEFDVSRDGTQIRVLASGDVPEADVASLLEGAILGGAMRLLGKLCLHASVLVAGGSAVALMGESRAGKSSLACALMGHGSRLLSDDFATIEFHEDGVFVQPGRIRLRLWPDSAARLASASALLERLYPSVPVLEKLILSDPDAISREPARLAAIYVLASRESGLEAPRIDAMAPGERLARLAENLYGQIAPEAEARRAELSALARLTATVPIHQLTLPDDLMRLPEVAGQLQARLFD